MKMLVTQALDERDLLVKKINDKIAKARFVDVKKCNEEKVMEERVTKREFEKQAKAAFQQIKDLIDNYTRIDAAIVASNAHTFIETSYGTFTVAAAIALRSRLDRNGAYGGEGTFEDNLNQKMDQDYRQCVRMAELKNKSLSDTAEQMRLSILGKDTKVKEDKPLEVVEAYVKQNTTELVDPLGVQKLTEEMKEKRETLLTELNTQIKVSNATTFIEV